jgi:hypothetical protein
MQSFAPWGWAEPAVVLAQACPGRG